MKGEVRAALRSLRPALEALADVLRDAHRIWSFPMRRRIKQLVRMIERFERERGHE
jgi:hypothetical protein